MAAPRMTIPTQAVLSALLSANAEQYGLEIIRATGLTASTIYPVLQRLLAAGWVSARWEAEDHAHDEGRPARRYYQLTTQGHARATHALHSTRAQRSNLARLLGRTDPATATDTGR